jgi:predicted nucleic acid-binding protein
VVAARIYADASALVKLILAEPESDALRDYLATRTGPMTSRIAMVEVRRAVARTVVISAEHEAVLAAIWAGALIVDLDEPLAEAAARIAPHVPRSLDAIHLATAASARDEVDAFVTYDRRLAEAARSLGMAVVAPA